MNKATKNIILTEAIIVTVLAAAIIASCIGVVRGSALCLAIAIICTVAFTLVSEDLERLIRYDNLKNKRRYNN